MIDKWQTSRKGNAYVNVQGHNVVVYPIGNRFTFRIVEPDDSVYESQTRFKKEDEAKEGASEAVRKLIEWG